VKSATLAYHSSIVVLLAIISIAFHELGHFIVYRLAGRPVRITLQSVRPIGNVSTPLNLLAPAAGPAFSLIAALVCLFEAWRRRSLFWVTAAFTNATLRLFPLVMDIVRAIEKTTPFSDEGDVVIAITTNPAARAILFSRDFSHWLWWWRAAIASRNTAPRNPQVSISLASRSALRSCSSTKCFTEPGASTPELPRIRFPARNDLRFARDPGSIRYISCALTRSEPCW
jgi:hypothetical protein